MAVYMAFLAGVLGWAFIARARRRRPAGGERATGRCCSPTAVVRAVYTIAATFGYVFPLRRRRARRSPPSSGTRRSRPTLLAEPRARSWCSRQARSRAVPSASSTASSAPLATVGAGAGGARRCWASRRSLGRPRRGATHRPVGRSRWPSGRCVGVGFGAVLTEPGRRRSSSCSAFTQFVEPVLRVRARRSTTLGRGRSPRTCRARPARRSPAASFYAETGLGDAPRRGGRAPSCSLALRRSVLAAVGRVTTFRRDIT